MEKTLYNQISTKTNEKVVLARTYEQEHAVPQRVFFEQDGEKKEKTRGFLRKRHAELDASRPDQKWEMRHKQFEAKVVMLEDGRANINLPIEKATIENKLADMESMPPIVNFIPTAEDDVNKIGVTKVIWDYVWVEGDTKREITKHRLQSQIMGTSIWFEGLEKEIETKYVPKIGKDGKVTGEVKVVTKSWLGGYMLDLRDVWIDTVSDINRANDCFILERGLSDEALENLKKDPNFNADAIDVLLAKATTQKRGQTANGGQVFTTDEELQDNTDCKYNLMHYYHKEKGMYVVSDDNFDVIIREGVNPYPHGKLPITLLVDHRNLYSIYGYGECELLESTKYERNEIRNQILDGTRISNTMNLLVGENAAFLDNEMVGGIMNIWNVEGNSNDAKFLQSPSPNAAIFNVDEILKHDGTWITGIDNNSLVGAGTKTAFEAELQERTKLKRIAMSLMEFDYWLRDMARQRLANIQFFMPSTTGKRIVGTENAEKFRTIAVQGMAKKPIKRIGKNKKPVEVGLDFEKKEGSYAFFELTPDLIASNLDVSVETPATTPILKNIQRQSIKTFLGILLANANHPAVAQILQGVNFEKMIGEEFREAGLDPEEYMNTAGEETSRKNVFESVMGGIPAPGMTQGQPGITSLPPDPAQTAPALPPTPAYV